MSVQILNINIQAVKVFGDPCCDKQTEPSGWTTARAFPTTMNWQQTDPGDVVCKHQVTDSGQEFNGSWLYLGFKCPYCSTVFIVSDLKDLRHRPCL
jgi:hypothetical protein